MFKNRALQVKMVKDEKSEPPQTHLSDQIEMKTNAVRIASLYTQSTIRTLGKVVITYIAADTIRQVMVAKASK